jgi:hypothetical protein
MKLFLPIIFLVCAQHPEIAAQHSNNSNLFQNLSFLVVENAMKENRFDLESKTRKIQTNPSKAIFDMLMEGEYGQVNSIEMYNTLGLCIFNSQIPSTRKNLTGIPQGVYLVRFITEDKIISEKITIGEVRSYLSRPAFVGLN